MTENVIIRYDREAATILHQLRQMGIYTCLDDFGTGYSSLSYLHQLPFDVIKVDRSFTQNLVADNTQSREVVRSILRLAEALGMETIAEGAETAAQLAAIRELGFRWAQGYALYHPLEKETMAKLFRVQ
ncbi:EAL domain-containing protein [Alkalilimnicola ehrlichii]|uniref:EAL domain-containing protein n=1 Tax=Alkalilimnicola ehrlichii TaxID=351052 RepID=UPI002869382C|nr:EAL domain-containing protein [Alkalilimnicola ehrlichii]